MWKQVSVPASPDWICIACETASITKYLAAFHVEADLSAVSVFSEVCGTHLRLQETGHAPLFQWFDVNEGYAGAILRATLARSERLTVKPKGDWSRPC